MNPTSVYSCFDVPEVINAVGYATRVGGSNSSAAVIQAMMDAQSAYIEIDDLQAAAWRVIAGVTGAEGGIVTCGAAAALTLGAAACLTGLDPEKMEALPDTSGIERNEIIYPRVGRFHYDHAVRLSGARIVAIDFAADDALDRIAEAIGPATAAIGYAWHQVDEHPSIDALISLAHEHDIPLLVDAAMSLPPTGNLRKFVARGADLVAFSGGKHLGGPQASAVLCGRADLIRSAWVQMVDMDVRTQTWSLGDWLEKGWISRPPRHGIGRSMKVGKEAVVGLMAALTAYAERDHDAELAGWHEAVDYIAGGLSEVPGLTADKLFPSPTGQPFPVVRLRSAAMTELLKALAQRRPKVIMAEDEDDAAVAYIYPMCLKPGEPQAIVAAISCSGACGRRL